MTSRAHNFIDMAGRVYGKWTVIDYVQGVNASGLRWNCRCVCGNLGVVSGGDLRRGHSTQCNDCRLGPILTGTTRGNLMFGKIVRLTSRNERVYSITCLLCGNVSESHRVRNRVACQSCARNRQRTLIGQFARSAGTAETVHRAGERMSIQRA